MTMMTSLPDPCTPMSVPAGSMHAHPHRVCTHACTRPMHACSHWVPMHTCLQGPCTHACIRSPHLLTCGAHLARSHQAPTPTRSLCMHTPGPYTHAHSRSPCMHAPGLFMPNYTRPPCPLTYRVPMHMCQISALMHAASYVVCNSSYM